MERGRGGALAKNGGRDRDEPGEVGPGVFRVGCSGYQYDDWRGIVYPAGMPKSKWFAHYASLFDTVELNSTFYRLPEAKTFDAWRDRAPMGFSYAVKLSRYGTHLKRLAGPDAWVPKFVERADHLGGTLGPILVQLPPRWDRDPDRLDHFLAVAGTGHRWALEVRDSRWLCDEVFDVLARHQAALCIHDLVPEHPRVVTAGWTYLRFHGPDRDHPYSGSYSAQALTATARWVRHRLEEGLDVYAYFNNDIGGKAVADASALRRYVGA